MWFYMLTVCQNETKQGNIFDIAKNRITRLRKNRLPRGRRRREPGRYRLEKTARAMPRISRQALSITPISAKQPSMAAGTSQPIP